MRYEVEFKSTTYHAYTVEAPSEEVAKEKALEELQMDTDVSSDWVEKAEINSIWWEEKVEQGSN